MTTTITSILTGNVVDPPKTTKPKVVKARTRKRAPRHKLHATDGAILVQDGVPVRLHNAEAGLLAPAELVALSHAVKDSAVKVARKGLRAGRHKIDMTLRIAGDIQIEPDVTRRIPSKLDDSRLLLALVDLVNRGLLSLDSIRDSAQSAETGRSMRDADTEQQVSSMFLTAEQTVPALGRTIPHLVITRQENT